jgi:multiple sugar transport system substrate-binding protein
MNSKIDKKTLLLILLGVGVVLILGILIIVLLRKDGGSNNDDTTGSINYSGELTYWGLWEPDSVMQSVISSYESLHPGVTINYVQKSFSNYDDNLYGLLTEGSSSDILVPDIFRIGNAWLPKYQKYLAALPTSIMSVEEYTETFHPTVVSDFTGKDGSIYAIPWSIDGLGIIYNKQLLQSAGYDEPPSDWDTFVEAAQAMTIRDDSGQITQSGLAMGTANNIRHSASILSYLFLLNKVDLIDTTRTVVNLENTDAEIALTVYTEFTDDEEGTWSSNLRNDLDLFYEGKLAMMFAPSWRAFDIIEASPAIEFDIAPLPQLPGNEEIYYSMYWGEAVSAYCENKPLAWDFIKYLSSAEVQKELYSNASNIRSFGEPYSRKDLVTEMQGLPYVSAIAEMAPNMQAWQMGDQDFVERKLDEAITNVVEYGMEASTALKDAQSEINDQLAQSNI